MKIITIFFAIFFVGGLFYFEYDKINQEPITSWKVDSKADCAVVLTGGQGRVREGFDLLARKSVKKLIISGVYPNASLREIMPTWPFYGDMNEEDVFLDRRSGTTYGNAQQSLPIVEALHCRDVILITSHLHMYRAYAVFRAAFPEKIAIYKHSVVSGLSESELWAVWTEVIKSLFYALWAY